MTEVPGPQTRWTMHKMTRRGLALSALLCLLSCGNGSPRPGDGRSLGDGAKVDGSRGDGSGAGGPIGSPCTRHEDCTEPAGAGCLQTLGGGLVPTMSFPGGYCAKPCESDGGLPDCGTGATCVGFTSSLGGPTTSMRLCAKKCSRDEECRVAEGYVCRMVLPGLGYCFVP
jgi:hypothetical protein